MTQIQSDATPKRLSEAHIQQIVQTQMRQYRQRQIVLKRIAAGCAFLSLLAGGGFLFRHYYNGVSQYVAPVAHTKTALESTFGANSDDWTMAVAALLALSDVRERSLHAIVVSLHNDSLTQNLAKINQLENASSDDLLYFQALAHLKHENKKLGLHLLQQVSDNYPMKQKAFEILNIKPQRE
jgi:hypothetical protein